VSAGPWRPLAGREGYLVPVTPAAPSEAYQQPRVVVVSLAAPLVTVELADGRRITTSWRNVRQRALPQVDARPRVLAKPAPRIDPKHGTELTFDFESEAS
jgi:hypothetical protein